MFEEKCFRVIYSKKALVKLNKDAFDSLGTLDREPIMYSPNALFLSACIVKGIERRKHIRVDLYGYMRNI